MKLSFDQIKGITAGAVRIWEENDRIRFAKFTQKQTDAWYALDTVLGERAESSTGIRLDFYTNSSFFAFTVAKGKFYDIYVNGILSYLVTPESLSDGRFSISLNTSKGENRMTLVLPSHEPGALYSVELDDGATLTPHALGKKILFIGDSITQGWEAKYNSLCYAQRVARFFNADSLIQAVGGGFFDESILDEELDFDPEIVIVALGTNDWSRGDRATLSGKMNAFFNKLIKRSDGWCKFGISGKLLITPEQRTERYMPVGFAGRARYSAGTAFSRGSVRASTARRRQIEVVTRQQPSSADGRGRIIYGGE